MRNKFKFIVPIAAFTLGLASCNDFFEKDITAETPVIIIPTNEDTIYSNQVHFKWNGVDGATFYNLQLVSPSFDDIDAFLLDSNVTGEEFYQILQPGNYAYKLRAGNSGYQSEYAGPFNFVMDSVSDLSLQFMSLISPADGIYSNGETDIIVSWQNLFAAERYEYVLKIGDNFATGSILDQNLNINTLSYTIDNSFFAVEGTYFWGVSGANITGVTPYASRQINIDRTAPNNPGLVTPLEGATFDLAATVTFKWNKGTDPGTVNSPVTSTLEIATEEDFLDFIEITGITADSLEYEFDAVGDYWWRVKLIDGVGNVSEFYSTENQIIIE